MRSSLLKGLVVAVGLAAVLVPAAAAKPHHSTLKLALVPLPKARLGPAAAGLRLASGSGPQGDLGALRGYQLDYGSIFLAKPGLDEAMTSVSEYTTAHAAERALLKSKKQALREAKLLSC